MSTPSDLQALFASMKPRPMQSQDAQAAAYPSSEFRAANPQLDGQRFGLQSHAYPFPHGYQHPSVSSPIYSPGPVNTPPHHGSDILSPNVPTPRGDQQRTASADQAMSLLNLLKFSQKNQARHNRQLLLVHRPLFLLLIKRKLIIHALSRLQILSLLSWPNLAPPLLSLPL